jgi:hypothetical protein
MERSLKRGQGPSWTVAPRKERTKEREERRGEKGREGEGSE